MYAIKLNDSTYLFGWQPVGGMFTSRYKRYACLFHTKEDAGRSLAKIEKRYEPKVIEVSEVEAKENRNIAWKRKGE